MSKPHLAMVRQLPCVGCGLPAPTKDITSYCIDPHHILHTGEHGMALRSSDRWSVPACRTKRGNGCHDLAHAAGDDEAWFASRGVDIRAVAKALWTVRGDLHGMERIIARARQSAAMKGEKP